MPPPKLYDYSTADVELISGVTRIFYDFRSANGLLVPSFREDGEMYRSFAMQKYCKMKDRCNPNNKCYTGAVCAFDNFQQFGNWIISQPGYGTVGIHLDKDLFYDGGILRYSPETCCLIPKGLNGLLNEQFSTSEIAFDKSRNKYLVQIKYTLCGEQQRRKFFGRYECVDDAATAYFNGKRELVQNEVAESYKSHVDERVFVALKNWVPKHLR